MAIHDADPERRNLVVTSIAFIIFYMGNGVIDGNEVRIQLVNISFQNPWVLAVAAWLMLFWFALRYWQTHPDIVFKEIKDNILSFSNHSVMINYIEKTTNLKYKEENGFTINKFTITPRSWNIKITIIKNVKYSAEGALMSNTQAGEKTIILTGLSSYIPKLKLTIIAMIKKPGFTSFAVPYLLFYSAVIIPIFNL